MSNAQRASQGERLQHGEAACDRMWHGLLLARRVVGEDVVIGRDGEVTGVTPSFRKTWILVLRREPAARRVVDELCVSPSVCFGILRGVLFDQTDLSQLPRHAH